MNFSLKEIFKGLLSIVQLSRFVFLCRSFQATASIFYQSFVRLSRTFFIFLFRFVDHFHVFLSDSLFRLSHPNRFVNNFFIFFKLFRLSELFRLFPSSKIGILFRPGSCSASASLHGTQSFLIFCCFLGCSSATQL